MALANSSALATFVTPNEDPGRDYLAGFLLGTRQALFDNDRQSITITVPRVDARTVGEGLACLTYALQPR